MNTDKVAGFPSQFLITVDPEFPGDGRWTQRVFCYDRQGVRRPEVDSRWGPPLIIGVRGTAGEEWIGMFAAGGLGGIRGIFGLPGGERLCVVADGLAYLVSLTEPGPTVEVVDRQVQQVVTDEASALLLLADFTGVVALGSAGILWVAQGVALDGLKIERVEARVVRCQVDGLEGKALEVNLDVSTGAHRMTQLGGFSGGTT